MIAKYAGNPYPATSYIHDQVRELILQGHKVVVVIPKPYFKDRTKNKPTGQLINLDGVPYRVVPYLSLSNFGEYHVNNYTFSRVVESAVRRLKHEHFTPQIIQVHTFSAPSYAGLKLQQKLGIPCVITTHGSDLRIPLSLGKQTMIVERTKAAGGVITVSQALQEILTDLGIPSKVILNGFNFIQSDTNDKDPHLITTCAYLKPSKNIDILIRSFTEVLSEVPTAKLQIIGDGPMKQELMELCAQLGVEDQVQFLGHMPNREVLREMNRSPIFALPSVQEGFGIVYLEAMSQQCFVIATRGEGFSSFAKDGIHCRLVEGGSVSDLTRILLQALRFPIETLQIAQAGYSLALTHTWTENVQQTLAYYQQIIERYAQSAQ